MRDGISRSREPLRLPFCDVAAVRSILAGESVIDWHRLDLTNDEQVIRLLRVNEFNVEVPDDMRRLEGLRNESVEYLRRALGISVSRALSRDVPVMELLRIASGRGRKQVTACMILKVMHIIYHLDGHELHYRLPVSMDELGSLAEAKVVQVVDEIRTSVLPVVEFSWSRKTRESLITKLLAKRETFASRVYDRLRFRIVVEEVSDLVPLLWELQHRLIPFNYVIPGESINRLVGPEELLAHLAPRRIVSGTRHKDSSIEDLKAFETFPFQVNEFSSPDYRIINFVADLPIRLEDFLPRLPVHQWDRDVVVTFIPAEFQIADRRTAEANEQGESKHEAYKARQRSRVRTRLGGDPSSKKQSY